MRVNTVAKRRPRIVRESGRWKQRAVHGFPENNNAERCDAAAELPRFITDI